MKCPHIILAYTKFVIPKLKKQQMPKDFLLLYAYSQVVLRQTIRQRIEELNLCGQ